MNALLSIISEISTDTSATSLGQPKYEKKISRKSKFPQLNQNVSIIPANADVTDDIIEPITETYTVKSGDSMSSIVYRFYGKYDLSKVEKIKQVNIKSEYLTKIGNYAFANCKKLKKVKINAKALKKIGKKVVKSTSKSKKRK